MSRKVHSGHADVHETEQQKECAQDVKVEAVSQGRTRDIQLFGYEGIETIR